MTAKPVTSAPLLTGPREHVLLESLDLLCLPLKILSTFKITGYICARFGRTYNKIIECCICLGIFVKCLMSLANRVKWPTYSL